jgi:oxygen-independent coproporphyrinogen-3 oxidase
MRLLPGAEITLEANPGTVEQGRFREFGAAGINRLSIGVQSFDDGLLQRLGRIHGRAEALRAAETAHAAGLANFNLDLMFGLPEQSPAQAEADVALAIALAPSHLSYYQLTLEPNTAFAHTPPALPDDDLRYEMQTRGQALLAAAGYAQYEVSGYSRAGHRCRHNLNYWEFGDYLGIGAGAHGKITGAPVADPSPGRTLNGSTPASRPEDGPPTSTGVQIRRRWKLRHPVDYLEKAATAQRIAGENTLEHGDAGFEFMLNALRLNEGFSTTLFSERTGLPINAIAQPLREAERRGLLTRDASRIQPTAQGSLFLNELLELFLP